MGTAPAPLTSAELILFGSVISRVSGDVAATDTTAVANTSSVNRMRMLTSERNLILAVFIFPKNTRRTYSPSFQFQFCSFGSAATVSLSRTEPL
jgi:hypothetical protein